MFEPKMNAESLHTHVLHPVKGGSNVAVTLNFCPDQQITLKLLTGPQECDQCLEDEVV